MMSKFCRLTALALCSGVLSSACSGVSPSVAELGAGGSPSNHAGAAGDGAGGTDVHIIGSGGNASGGAASGGSSAGGAGSSRGDWGVSGGASLPEFADYPDAGFDYVPTHTEPEVCARVTGTATLRKRPMDIIFSIDNSSSMGGEIEAVQARINNDFAQIIGDSGIDYRVIMVSKYGNVFFTIGSPIDGACPVCIGAPLGNPACPTGAGSSTPTLVNDRPNFFHHNTPIGSSNMWCKLMSSYDASATSAPNGWKVWLRPEAFKVFVGITDDSPGSCSLGDGIGNSSAGAQAFDTQLRALSAEQFGTAEKRNYAWYSIVGMSGSTTPLAPSAAVQTSVCSGAMSAGRGYQELSKLTGGLRYSSCLNANFDAMFNAIAAGVIEKSAASCEYALPDPEGGSINPDNIVATYHPSALGGSDVTLGRINSVDQCGSAQGFYLDDNTNPSKLFLCEQACNVVQADASARIDIDFGCLGS